MAVGAEVTQKGNLRASFEAKMRPQTLPRLRPAPITVSVATEIRTTDGTAPPTLRRFEIAMNSHGRLNRRGLPTCRRFQIQPATTENARRSCGRALVGEGSFAAAVGIPEQSPFPSQGKLLAFNGVEKGKPVIFAHVYGTEPVPTSFTLPLRISRTSGTFGTVLSGDLPEVTSNIAYVTGISLSLGRRFSYRGEVHGYLSASCPAPEGFSKALFALARSRFHFEDGRTLGSTMTHTCGVRK